MTIEYEKEFSTTDLGLAAALLTDGFIMTDADKSDKERVRFVFQREKGIEQAMLDFFDGKLKLSAIKYFNNQKILKNRIYNE